MNNGKGKRNGNLGQNFWLPVQPGKVHWLCQTVKVNGHFGKQQVPVCLTKIDGAGGVGYWLDLKDGLCHGGIVLDQIDLAVPVTKAELLAFRREALKVFQANINKLFPLPK